MGASVVETITEKWGSSGHADAPLSRFPGYLLLAPFVPVWTAADLFEAYSTSDLVATGVFAACFIAFWLSYKKLVPFDM
jgi:hypothetical protein